MDLAAGAGVVVDGGVADVAVVVVAWDEVVLAGCDDDPLGVVAVGAGELVVDVADVVVVAGCAALVEVVADDELAAPDPVDVDDGEVVVCVPDVSGLARSPLSFSCVSISCCTAATSAATA